LLIVLILAFDTATRAVTVALHDGRRALAQESVIDARRHGELLAPMIARVLAAGGAEPGDLTSVAVGTGPGPYTGLRAGLATAQALGHALGIGVAGLCTLDVIAAQARAGAAGREFVVATDARRREVYWARYSPDGERIGDPQVSAPDQVPAGCPVAGEGPTLYPVLGADGGRIEPRYPAAATLADMASRRAAAYGAAEPPRPLYLRRPDAREPGRPKRVLGKGR
jgi:tRNA threonylcarbamoyl adenosine modification protein YeaZ